jgi:hypothetical protein
MQITDRFNEEQRRHQGIGLFIGRKPILGGPHRALELALEAIDQLRRTMKADAPENPWLTHELLQLTPGIDTGQIDLAQDGVSKSDDQEASHGDEPPDVGRDKRLSHFSAPARSSRTMLA